MKKRSVVKRNQGDPLPGLRVLQNECVWMRAGVVNFKICDHGYDCFHCDFDVGMRKALDAQRPPKGKTAEKGWAAEMRKRYPGAEKPCRYLLTGQIDPPGQCQRDYECDDCPIHMALEYQPVSRSIEAERYAQEVRSTERGNGAADLRALATECIWMKAGIINFKLCNEDYDCYGCAFDQSMRSVMGTSPGLGKSRDEQWHAFMNEHYATGKTPCIHRLTGNLEAPVECTQQQQCYRCPYHQQYLASQWARLARESPEVPEYRYAAGFRLADNYYYHLGHAWVHIEEDGIVRVGMDDFVSNIFGTAKAFQLPPKGVHLTQGKSGWVLLRNGNKAAIQAPITGKVVAFNSRALEDPRICHDDPYSSGWIMCMEPSSLKLDLNALYFGEESLRWMESENRILHDLLGPQYAQLASTGAQPIDDLFDNVPGLSWETLTENFLRTKRL